MTANAFLKRIIRFVKNFQKDECEILFLQNIDINALITYLLVDFLLFHIKYFKKIFFILIDCPFLLVLCALVCIPGVYFPEISEKILIFVIGWPILPPKIPKFQKNGF